jgi:hypothetical protein
MIVRKRWRKVITPGVCHYDYEGWFLFGIIPLYIRRD